MKIIHRQNCKGLFPIKRKDVRPATSIPEFQMPKDAHSWISNFLENMHHKYLYTGGMGPGMGENANAGIWGSIGPHNFSFHFPQR